MEVTVDNLTVVITDYPAKKQKLSLEATKNSMQSDMSDTSSNASNDIVEERTVNNNNNTWKGVHIPVFPAHLLSESETKYCLKKKSSWLCQGQVSDGSHFVSL